MLLLLMYNVKPTVPNDDVSARRDLDDADMLGVLERCYRLLQGRRDSNPGPSNHSAPSPAVPGTILAKCLKRHTYDLVKTRLTCLDTNLYDVIWPSVKKLPPDDKLMSALEEDFPFGVIAPDHNTYAVFHEFFNPFLKEIHCLNILGELSQPIPTYLVPADDAPQEEFDYNLDPSGKWILSGVLEMTRNLNDYNYPRFLSIGELEEVERVLTIQLMRPAIVSIIHSNLTEEDIEELGPGTYYTLNEVLEDPSEVRSGLETAGLMIPLWNLEDSDRLHGKHWPYGRGVFVSSQRNLAAWINVLDHIRIVVRTPLGKPGNIGNIYSKISKISYELNKKLMFRRDDRIGFLSVRPTSIGNALQFRLNVRFRYLSKEADNLKHLCYVRGLTLKETSHPDVLRVGNQQCLGVTEVQTFEDFATAVSNILQLEKDLAMHNSMHIAQLFVNMFRRKKSSLIAND